MNTDLHYTEMMAILMGGIIFLLIIILIFKILYIVGRWNLFKKAGKNGWEAIIPFYNDWIYVEIAGLSPWWFILVIASRINLLLNINQIYSIAILTSLFGYFGLFVCNYNISKKLNKDVTVAILMTFFPFVMLPLIGLFNNYKWDDSVIVSNNGPFNSSQNVSNMNYSINNKYPDNQVNNDIKYCTNCGNRINSDVKFCNNCGREI